MHKYFGIENLTLDIKSQAKNLGFMSCGISEARFLEEEAPKLEEWLNNNMNGKMSVSYTHLTLPTSDLV